MADIDQAVSAVKGTTGPVTQRWKEFLTGAYARLTGSLLYAMSSGSSGEFSVRASTAGNLHVELQPSTEVVGLLGASTAMVGHAILDASTARIGSLYPSTETIGALYPSTARIGSLYPSTERIGSLYPSTETIGALYPSTNAIGVVGGIAGYPSAVLVTTTSQAYSTGDLIGGELSFASAFRSTANMTGIVQSIVIADAATSGQSAIDLWLFKTQTTGTTYTNDTALTIDDADLSKIIGRISVTEGDYYQFANNAAAVLSNVGLPVCATTGTTLYGAAICRSTAPAYSTGSSVTVTLGILQD